MKAIVLNDDELNQLEKRFGNTVRHMGSWNSDGIFGYCSVRMNTVEKAANILNHPHICDAVQELKVAPDPTPSFVELLKAGGPALVEQIVAAHNERFPMSHAPTSQAVKTTAA